MRNQRFGISFTLVVPVLVSVACGGSGDDTATQAPAASAGAGGATAGAGGAKAGTAGATAGAAGTAAGAGGAKAGAAGASSGGAGNAGAAGTGGAAGAGQGGGGASGKAGASGSSGSAGQAGQAGQAGNGGSAGAAGSTQIACMVDADCTGFVPETSPPGCARGLCDPGAKTCRFVARDKDADGFNAKTCLSKQAGATIEVGDDCDDSDPDTNPKAWDGPPGDGHPDRCGDAIDQDCNGKPDDGALANGTTCTCPPGDVRACSEDSSGKPIKWPAGAPKGECRYGAQTCQAQGTWGPCTDAVIPSTETCNGKDDDCDGLSDESDAVNRKYWWWDSDNDYHAAKGYAPVLACSPPNQPPNECPTCKLALASWKENLVDDDCDDTDPSRRPGQTEVCDGKDNDCNGSIDDSVSGVATWTFDEDGDGHAIAVPKTLKQCAPPGSVAAECFGLPVPCQTHWTTSPISQQDCDDTDAARFPGNWDGPATTQAGLEDPWAMAVYTRNSVNVKTQPTPAEQPAAVTTSHTLDWSFGSSAPLVGGPKTYLALRASGTLLVPTTGDYTFTVTADDGSRLYLDGALVVDRWTTVSTPTTAAGTSTLTAGPHDLYVDFYRTAATGGTLKVEWSGPGVAKRLLVTHDDSSYGDRAGACDGKDNDCSLTPDDGLATAAGAGRRCVAATCNPGSLAVCGGASGGNPDLGSCQGGVKTCDLGGTWGSCVGSIEPATRDCSKTLDKNCDGTPDNTESACTCTLGAVQTCEEHPGKDGVGICRSGTQKCISNASSGTEWEACSQFVAPATETCSAATDLDCDGVVGNGGSSCKQQVNMNTSDSFSIYPNGSVCDAPEEANGLVGTAGSKTWGYTNVATSSGPDLIELSRCTDADGLHSMVTGKICPSGTAKGVGYLGAKPLPGWVPVYKTTLLGGRTGFCSAFGCLLVDAATLNGCNWGSTTISGFYAPP